LPAPDPILILQDRAQFLNSLVEVATICNWPKKRIEELRDYVYNEMVRIDNLLYDVFEATDDKEEAKRLWHEEMESLRYWLSLVLEVKIKYI